MKTRVGFRTATIVSVTAAVAVGAGLTAATVNAAPGLGPQQLQDAPLKAAKETIVSTAQKSTHNSITLGWKTQASSVTSQTSTTSPSKNHQGVWGFGQYVQPVAHKGKLAHAANTKSLKSGASTYKFDTKIEGLSPSKTYFTLIQVPAKAGHKPAQLVYKTVTAKPGGPNNIATKQSRTVMIAISKVKVVKDGDLGARGKGEVRFGARMAPNANAALPSDWGNFSHSWDEYAKAGNGETVKFDEPLRHTIVTDKNRVLVELQGMENDIPLGSWCKPSEGPRVARTDSDKCFDRAVASKLVTLSTAPTGVTNQVAVVKVPMSSKFSFEATVHITSWMNK